MAPSSLFIDFVLHPHTIKLIQRLDGAGGELERCQLGQAGSVAAYLECSKHKP